MNKPEIEGYLPKNSMNRQFQPMEDTFPDSSMVPYAAVLAEIVNKQTDRLETEFYVHIHSQESNPGPICSIVEFKPLSCTHSGSDNLPFLSYVLVCHVVAVIKVECKVFVMSHHLLC